MLCEAECDAGGPNQLSETIGIPGLFTGLGIPTRATRLKTHHLVRFFVGFPCPVDFCANCSFVAGRANATQIRPMTPKHKKTVMQRLLVYQFTWRLMAYWNNPTNLYS